MSATATATGLDLWPQDLEPKGQPSPSAILRQQGYRLGERTDQVVYGEVESLHENREFRHTLVLTASYLKLRQPIVAVKHKLSPYPADVWSMNDRGDTVEARQVRDAEQLREFLREVFKYPTTIDLIQSLLAQTRDLDADAE